MYIENTAIFTCLLLKAHNLFPPAEGWLLVRTCRIRVLDEFLMSTSSSLICGVINQTWGLAAWSISTMRVFTSLKEKHSQQLLSAESRVITGNCNPILNGAKFNLINLDVFFSPRNGSFYQIWCLTFYLLQVEEKVHGAWKYLPRNQPTKNYYYYLSKGTNSKVKHKSFNITTNKKKILLKVLFFQSIGDFEKT